MYYNSIYSQLFNFIPRYRFEKIVKKSGGNQYCKHFAAWNQFRNTLRKMGETGGIFYILHRKPVLSILFIIMCVIKW